MPHPFDRDLSYLLPFLGRVVAYAEAQPEPLRGALLAELDGEAARWATIQALLDGAAPKSTPEATPGAAPVQPRTGTPRPGFAGGWTIGPLSP
ncbi:MAG: hypothetical protein RIT28_2796, partial [Pseudomonadota bacterium]